MAILDSQGRLFGKVSILDIGAALVILLVILGIFVFPGPTGSTLAQLNPAKPIEVDVVVRGLNVLKPQDLIKQFETEKKTNIIIRNQPYGQVEIKAVRPLPRSVIAPQPDGSVKALPDPRAELALTADMVMTLAGKAQVTDDGLVLGNTKIKIGVPVELEGKNYDFNSTVIDIRY